MMETYGQHGCGDGGEHTHKGVKDGDKNFVHQVKARNVFIHEFDVRTTNIHGLSAVNFRGQCDTRDEVYVCDVIDNMECNV